MFTTAEKDAMYLAADAAYVRCYGEPTSCDERYYVRKGMEAFAAVLYPAIEDKLRRDK